MESETFSQFGANLHSRDVRWPSNQAACKAGPWTLTYFKAVNKVLELLNYFQQVSKRHQR